MFFRENPKLAVFLIVALWINCRFFLSNCG
jgi:hypothetical protein